MAIDDSRPIPALTPADIDRFWSKVDKSPGNGPHGDCWLWVGGKSDGYGAFYLNGENFGAHRVSLLIKTGEDPREYRSCHTCDFPPCVNPEHLFKGTDTDNRRDAINKGRAVYATGEHHGTATHPKAFLSVKGHRNPSAKLTQEQVKNARQMLSGGMSQQSVADFFGVHQMTISRVFRHKTYFV